MKTLLKMFLVTLLVVCIGITFASCAGNETDTDTDGTDNVVACEHSYDNACDTACNSCGAERTVDGHVAAADDGDCTTAIKCSICGAVVTAGKAQHEASADDGDCTTDIKCSVCEKTLTAGKSQHVASADDGDCSTAVKCTDCDCVVTAAKTHDFTGAWQTDETDHWHVCANRGCNATDTKAAHTEGTDGKCTDCGRVMRECVNHEYTITNYDENGHWKECACGDKQAAVGHDLSTEGDCTTGYACNGCDFVSPSKNHTPEADDGDCTTAINCSECGCVAVAGKTVHVPSTDGSCTEGFPCTDSNCTWVSVPTDHTPEADDGDCTTEVKCGVCGEVVVKAKEEHVDENGDTVCDVEGCDKSVALKNDADDTESSWGELLRPSK